MDEGMLLNPSNYDSSTEQIYMDKEIQKWLLEVESQKESQYHNLLGESLYDEIVEKENSKGEKKNYIRQIWKSDPNKIKAMNHDGASAIKSLMDNHINRTTLLGTLTTDTIRRIVLMFSYDIVDTLVDNFEEFEVNDQMKDIIVSGLRAWMLIILSRTQEGKNDRKFFQQTTTTQQRIIKPEEAGKGFLGIHKS